MRMGLEKAVIPNRREIVISLWRFLFLGYNLMNSEGFKRKLSAILSADVAGYHRLMGVDDATVRTLKGHREMKSTLINQHQGQVHDSLEDSVVKLKMSHES